MNKLEESLLDAFYILLIIFGIYACLAWIDKI